MILLFHRREGKTFSVAGEEIKTMHLNSFWLAMCFVDFFSNTLVHANAS